MHFTWQELTKRWKPLCGPTVKRDTNVPKKNHYHLFLIFFKEINSFIQQECIYLIKVAVKTYKLLAKIYISNKCSTFYSSINPEKKYHGFHKNIKHNSFQQWFNNEQRNVSWTPNQHIKMISERSCDNEDCNDAENSALPSR